MMPSSKVKVPSEPHGKLQARSTEMTKMKTSVLAMDKDREIQLAQSTLLLQAQSLFPLSKQFKMLMFTQPAQTPLLELLTKVSTSTPLSKLKEVSQPINMLALKLQLLKKTTGLSLDLATALTKTLTQPTAHATVDASPSRMLLLANNGGSMRTTRTGNKTKKFTTLRRILIQESITKLTRLSVKF